jgi:hypothetical protein
MSKRRERRGALKWLLATVAGMTCSTTRIQGQAAEKCANCQGSGKCSSCGGGGKGPVGEGTCIFCNVASGICLRCKGTGKK